MNSQPNERLCALLDQGRQVVIFTGAGISTASGIPDFRGPGGVWTRRQPVYYDQFIALESARIEHWDYKLEGWSQFRDAQPNAVHHAIADLERAGKLLKVITQNIDGLHEKAGTSRDCLVEVHGTNAEVECQSCHRRSDPEPHFEHFKQTHEVPVCECGGYLKPATISFGQSLRPEDVQAAKQAAGQADLVVALGSTLSVYPAASMPLMPAQRGAPYVVINRGPTEHDSHPLVTLRLEGDVTVIFPPAVERILKSD